MTNEAKARSQIRFELRQADGDYMPARYRSSPAVADLVDSDRAEQIFEEEVARLEAASGQKFGRIEI